MLSSLRFVVLLALACYISNMTFLHGISPDKKEGYRIPSIDRDFGGYEMMAYYYVSWALAIPDKVKMLGMPFDTAYQNALQMFKLMK